MLQHEAIAVGEWHDNEPQDLVTVSLFIQIAINNMHLSLLSVAYVCPYHNPTTSMGHSVHNADISKLLATQHHTHCLPSALYSENQDSSMKRTILQSARSAIKGEHLPTQVGYDDKLVRMTSMQMSFPEMVSDSLCRNSLVMQTNCCISCPGGWSQTISTALVDIPAVSMPSACSLKTCNICGIVLCDKTAHFRVAFYCDQLNTHLYNNHAV